VKTPAARSLECFVFQTKKASDKVAKLASDAMATLQKDTDAAVEHLSKLKDMTAKQAAAAIEAEAEAQSAKRIPDSPLSVQEAVTNK
jgi:hypothetical protein